MERERSPLLSRYLLASLFVESVQHNQNILLNNVQTSTFAFMHGELTEGTLGGGGGLTFLLICKFFFCIKSFRNPATCIGKQWATKCARYMLVLNGHLNG